jgi:hypothetical protein
MYSVFSFPNSWLNCPGFYGVFFFTQELRVKDKTKGSSISLQNSCMSVHCSSCASILKYKYLNTIPKEVACFFLFQAEKLMKQIGVKNVKLSEYEMSIAAHLVDPLNMHVCIFNLWFIFFPPTILCQGPGRV